ncbi:beta-L-arabinofuranosidase domain-containing protein [Flavobacterium selenitireducens]|uniref:beta-L-arabinofuranosidase domain-containing protein n=1 Tax=Flavobacterium selenitireducens TaxID=2722704 RepID=UPI00168B40F3|nr:beta-L-arabinofuranosidase domain-containing protein [Flavobacterium selenitireducens]MBD3582489.1 hypothetical protein [Flavobacterium selenitireducens]
MKTILYLSLFTLTVSAQTDPYKKTNPIPEKLEILPLNAVKPHGWIKEQIIHNLDGFTGHLDQLAPDLIVSDDIYDKNRLSKKVKSKDVGAIGGEGDWQVQFLWWNSETQSNWRDGYIRSAILANDEAHLSKIKTYVDKILASQDKDGYLGIYDEELRYTFDNENGELWAKASLLRGLLAWYDYSKDEKVLHSVKRAVDNTMNGFPINASHPFYSKNANVGGLSHGLTFTDVLEDLYRLTKNQKYLDYALFLYKDFSENKLNEDAQYAKLMDENLMLNGHGVHTYEHLRSLAVAYNASGNPELLKARERFENKIKLETTASGGPVGDEWIGSRKADATNRGYEYCSLQELMHSYESLLAKTGKSGYADKVEKLFFNAAQGARHPEQSCIAYLKSDNSYEMTGGLNGDKSDAKQTRYRYSPVHKEAAVCCVPNAGRIAPYFVQHMWLKDKNSLVAALLGPSEVTTKIGNIEVSVVEKTAYPFEDRIEFQVTANGKFDLKIRKPEWLKRFDCNLSYKEENGYLIFSRKWSGTESVILTLHPTVETRQDLNDEFYFSYGALVLAHPIKGIPQVTKTYALREFSDVNYTAENPVVYQFGKPSKPVALGDSKFATSLVDPQTGNEEKVVLQPMARTILRQVTFKR